MILITGATGMIGRALVSHLGSQGYDIRAHARLPQQLESLFPDGHWAPAERTAAGTPATAKLEPVIADLSTLTAGQAEKLCRGVDTVIHTAALVHKENAPSDLYESANIKATELLADAARACRIKQFIFLSSTSVYGDCPTTMIDESGTLHPDTPYSASKIACEEYLRLHRPAPSTVLLRCALVFGEGDRGNMSGLIRQVTSGKYFIIGAGASCKSLIYAGDLARAISLIVKKPTNKFELFNIANPEPVTVKQLSQAILAACGKNTNLLSLPYWFVLACAAVANCLLAEKSPLTAERLDKLTRDNSVSVSAFRQAYDFSPVYDLNSSLSKEIAWLREDLNR